ncbi:MAG: hypothetical protein IKM44_02930 [Clostridia bacterium]|nr:hypothetical protein [Clostridia bacterium]
MKKLLGIKKLSKIFTATILAVMLCVAFFSLPLFSHISVLAQETTAPVTYKFFTSKPVYITASENDLYALTEDGKIINIEDMSVINNSITANNFQAINSEIFTPRKNGKVFSANLKGEITDTQIFIYEDTERVLSDSIGKYLCGVAHENYLFVFEELSNRISLSKINLNDGTSQTLKYDVDTDAEIISVAYDGENVYYATPYSLYSTNRAESYNVGGITSLTTIGKNLYYTTRSGKICQFTNGNSETLFSTSEKINVDARGSITAFSDYGNHSITVIDDHGNYKIPVSHPSDVAIAYDGSILVSSENKIIKFEGKSGVLKKEYSFADLQENIVQVKTDLFDVSSEMVYAITQNNKLLRSIDNKTLDNVKAVEVFGKEIYVLTTSGGVIKYDENLSNPSQILSDGNFDGFFMDNAKNVYRYDNLGIYKNTDSVPYSVEGLTDVALSRTKITKNGVLGFGDLITIAKGTCHNGTISRDELGIDMLDNNDSYKQFIDSVNNSIPESTNTAHDIYIVEIDCYSYSAPTEMPATDSKRINKGTYAIVLGAYQDTDYAYALIETQGGGIYAFINVNTLSKKLPYTEPKENNCTATSIVKIYKHPSITSPQVAETTVGKSYLIKNFADEYVDGYSQKWIRIEYSDSNGQMNGYVLRNNVAINGTVGGDYKQIVPNAEIKCDKDFVDTYFDRDTSSVLGKIKNGTKVQMEEEFLKGREFTKITYVVNENTGATSTCFVKTEYLKHTEAGYYQVIMFYVGIVLIVAITIIVIIAVKRKNKIK